jgi:light-regulated signal transduction histidine kinase (bacteriophytochrome)
VINAIKFRKSDLVPQIRILVQRTGNYWEFKVADNGIGIEPIHRERIFVIFQRLHTHSEYPGSGIGLAICKKIIDQHKGLIYATGESDNGATFTIILPEHQ